MLITSRFGFNRLSLLNLPLLMRMKRRQLWLASVLISMLLSQVVVAGMALLLKGEIPIDYLLTGLVTSGFVASVVVAILSFFLEKLSESQLQLQAIIAAEPECLKLLAANGTILEINPAGLKMLEADSLEQVVGQHAEKLVLPEYRRAFAALIKRVFAGESGSLEFEMQGLKGTRLWLDTHAAPLHDIHGNIIALLAVTRNITERKHSEQALKKYSHDLTERVKELRCLYTVSELARQHDISAEQIIRHSLVALAQAYMYPEITACRIYWYGQDYSTDNFNKTRWSQQAAIIVHGESAGLIEVCYLEERPPEYEGVFLAEERKLLDGVANVLAEFFERQQTNERLKQSSARLAMLMNSVAEGIYGVDMQGNCTFINAAGLHLLGYQDKSELLGKHMHSAIHHTYPNGTPYPAAECRLYATLHSNENTHVTDEVFWRKDGSSFPVDYWSRPIALNDEPGAVVTFIDTTERKQAEQMLRTSESKLNFLLAHSPVTIYTCQSTPPFAATYISPNIEQTLGYKPEQFVGHSEFWAQNIHPEDQQRIFEDLQQLFEQGAFQHEYRFRTADGSYRWMHDELRLVRNESSEATVIVGYWVDITERKEAEEMLHLHSNILQNMAEGVFLVRANDGIIVFTNPRFEQMFGYGAGELLGKHVSVINAGDDKTAKETAHTLFVTLEQSGTWVGEVHNLKKDKTAFWCHANVSNFVHPQFGLVWVSVHEDITQRKEAETALRNSEQQLRESQQFFQSLAQVSPVGIYRTDAEGNCIFVNDKWSVIAGISEQQAKGKGWINAIMPEDREKVFSEWTVAVNRQKPFSLEYRFQRPGGKIIWVYGLATAIYDDTNKVSGYVGTITDISERKINEEHIHQLAFYDPLTGLPNRRLLQERLKHGIDVSHRSGDKMAVLMMDLDKFKAVNDSLGHAAGDELLKQVAKRITGRLREVDMVARLGGDEFVILMENIEHHEYVARVAEDIIHTLTQPFTLFEKHVVQIGASIGIAIHPQHGDDVEALMDHADTALYHAKYQGRGCFAYFTEDLTHQAHKRIALESGLRSAIATQQLQVYFQPQVEINSGKLIAAEALVRWHNPVYGCVMPNEFISVVEASGLIIPIDEWVLRETCRLGQAWRNAGLPELRLAVNVSAHQFRRGDINALVTEVLNETGFPAEFLELEITEKGLMENQEQAIPILNNLHQQGVRLAIDDFGSGYSSLALLKCFPLHQLKIDKSFIDNIPLLPEDMAITATIISMAHHLGFKVLAEGVESAAQLTFLREHSCDSYQGYFCSEPLPASDFQAFLSSGTDSVTG